MLECELNHSSLKTVLDKKRVQLGLTIKFSLETNKQQKKNKWKQKHCLPLHLISLHWPSGRPHRTREHRAVLLAAQGTHSSSRTAWPGQSFPPALISFFSQVLIHQSSRVACQDQRSADSSQGCCECALRLHWNSCLSDWEGKVTMRDIEKIKRKLHTTRKGKCLASCAFNKTLTLWHIQRSSYQRHPQDWHSCIGFQRPLRGPSRLSHTWLLGLKAYWTLYDSTESAAMSCGRVPSLSSLCAMAQHPAIFLWMALQNDREVLGCWDGWSLRAAPGWGCVSRPDGEGCSGLHCNKDTLQ